MSQTIQFQLSPEQAKDEVYIRSRIARELNINDEFEFRWRRRSIDARRKRIQINASFDVYVKGDEIPPLPNLEVVDVANMPEIAIIGSGPAGLFAAIEAIQKGLKPVVFERGKDVRSRRRDLAALNKEMKLDTESNYCFGEGGAGTYSDGKLYTRSKKRGNIKKALEWFVAFGAAEDIMVDAHPHIGTNKLPKIIVAMREYVRECGGEVHFESKITDIITENDTIIGLEINGTDNRTFDHVIIATGHSARDIFEMFNRKKWALEAKAFALGVRVEHPQSLIDQIQYHGRLNDEYLPPATYSLVTQVQDKGVYSFCMCPGGIIAPCATGEGEVVTNGWSPSKRNNPYANSGVVVTVEPNDIPGDPNNPLRCLNFQKQVEHDCWVAAGKTQRVPAQRMIDFMNGTLSKDLPETSYHPGLVCVDLNQVLPTFVASSLKKAFKDFENKMKGYVTNEAVLHAPESRTSSPIKIPRTEELEHPNIKGLYPCGEGAGYAGGIISAAIDGMKVVDMIAAKFESEAQH